MQIHELNQFSGTPSTGDWLAIDDGDETTKVEMESAVTNIATPIAEAKAHLVKCLVLSRAAFSSLPITITNSAITSDMVVVNSELGTPSAQTGDWTVTTSNGSLTVAGSISGSTTLKLYLMPSR